MTYLIVDGIIVVIVLLMVIIGWKKGFFAGLIGLAALVGGVIGGKIAKALFGKVVAEKLLLPGIQKLIDSGALEKGVENAAEFLEEFITGLELHPGLKLNVAEEAILRAAEQGTEAITAAADIIALRLAGWICAAVGFVVCWVVVLLLLRAVNATVLKLPVLKQANGFFGGVVGAAKGIILAGAALALVYMIFPALSHEGGVLSRESIENSYITILFAKAMPKLFGM